MELNKTINWINKTEGRDKFCKAIQYASRFLKWYLVTKNKDAAERFEKLFSSMRDARKLFRLFKALNEYHKIQQLLGKKSDDDIETLLQILNRLFFMLYWGFDNMVILCTIKFIKKDKAQYNRLGCTSWLLGLVIGLVINVRKMMNSYYEEMKIDNTLKHSTNETQNDTLRNKLNKIRHGRNEIYLNIVKTLGDMIAALNGSEIPQKLLNKSFNDGFVGVGGFLSAVITSYQLYKGGN
eukprot:TRINITY_DN3429_c0_g1_i2.p1 TRINITY_DN3429_c0_g1~~TRINITY_DN3429_c0_g1_i2.p1  ORF type:complete len:238 (-),score=16.32 TRINITY_DN3429_c0_g1_i2:68-781(-)